MTKWGQSTFFSSTKQGKSTFVEKCTLTPFLVAVLAFAAIGSAVAHEEQAVIRNYTTAPAAPAFQTWEDAGKKSAGCVSCHTQSDRKTMHANEAVVLGCTDCHGGNANVFAPSGEVYSADDHNNARNWSAGYHETMDKAHVLPRFPDNWQTSANPTRSYTAWLK